MFGRRGCDVIQNALIHCKVHELDAKLALDLSLFFNAVLDDDAHLFNGVHLRFLCHEDPILEHLVQIKTILAHAPELVQGPVSHLAKSVTEV